MTVQLPVLLWTVICFGALVLILNNLLFKPMLAFMDKRGERIRAAAEKKAAAERASSEAQEALERFRAEQEAHTASLAGQALAKARADADRLVSDAVRRGEEETAACRAALEREKEELSRVLESNADRFAEDWISALTVGRGGPADQQAEGPRD